MNKSLENKNETLSFNPWELYSGAPRSTEKTPPAPRKTEPKIVRNSGIVPVPESESSPVRGRESSPAPERKRASSSQIANGFDPFDDSMFRYRKKSAKVAAPTRETSAKTERKKQTTPNEAEAAAKQEKQTRSFAVSAVTNAVIKQRAPEAKTAQASAPAREISSAKTQKLAPIPANKKPESMPAEKTAERESEPAKHPTISRTKNSAPKSEAKNQKNTDPAKKFGDPFAPDLPPPTEKEKKNKRKFWKKAIASIVLAASLAGGTVMATSVWRDIRSGGAEMASQYKHNGNQEFTQDSQDKKAAPATPELKQWPDIPVANIDSKAVGQKAFSFTMPNGHELNAVVGHENRVDKDVDFMTENDVTIPNLGGKIAGIGEPGAVTALEGHVGYENQNDGFDHFGNGDPVRGDKIMVHAANGYTYELKADGWRYLASPDYNGQGPTLIEANKDGSPKLADPNDPNSVIPIEGSKILNDKGQFYADPMHPSDKSNGEYTIIVITCSGDSAVRSTENADGSTGKRVMTAFHLYKVYDKAGNLVAGDGKSPITGYTQQQIQDMEALGSAAKTADSAMNQ